MVERRVVQTEIKFVGSSTEGDTSMEIIVGFSIDVCTVARRIMVTTTVPPERKRI